MFDQLIGKTLLGAALSNHGETLTFRTTQGDYRYQAAGDCCSESWVESISENMFAINEGTVMKINEKSATMDGTRQDVDAVDFVTLVTDKGYFDIEFRNSSNGYYGGWMELVDVRAAG